MKKQNIIEERINKIADKIAKIITTIPHPKSFPKGKGLETPLLWRGVGVRLFQKSLSFLLILSFVTSWSYGLLPGAEKYSPEVKKAEATGSPWQIRQEINIVDGYLEATTGNYATSSAIVQMDTTKYSGTATYYFEVVASTSVSLASNVYLKTVAGATIATVAIPAGTTNPTLLPVTRAAFTPTAGATEYVVVIGNESGATKSIKAARIIIIQNFPDTAGSAATSTQTQIEIGNEETGKTNTSNSALSFPKYWAYDADKWDGTLTAYAEVTYQNTQTSSSTTYHNRDATTTTQSATYIASPGVSYVQVEAWGGGGGGGCVGTDGGSGGGGGGYAKSILAISAGTSKALSIGRGGTGDQAAEPAASTYDSTVVVGAAGVGGSNGTIGTGGTANTGQTTANGGNGGDGHSSDGSGAGGGAGGPNGVGGVGSTAPSANGGAGAQGNSTTGGTGGIGGVDNATETGGHGKYHETGGGGGGGGAAGGSGAGGNGGSPGGGGG
ncbi:MAG: hypothetical protein AAB961_01735, partial [Patescibacteria group bacterium]